MTTFTDEVRDTVSPHKFGGSRRAAAAYLISLGGFEDEQTGSTDWGCWYARIGRTILSEDDRGFVYAYRHDTEDAAKAQMSTLEGLYAVWDTDEYGRMTKTRLDERCANLNRRMESRGSVIRYAIQGRNGTTALDRTTPEGLERHTSLDIVRVGTKAEIGEFLHAMMTALDDAARKAV